MFGSEVGHMGVVRIAIHRAEMHRELSRDWIHGQKLVAEIEMTHSQFAAFITGVGRGEGTPCTLTAYGDAPAKSIAAIGHTPTKQDQFHREIREQAQHVMEGIQEGIAKLEKLLEGGSISKTRLKEIVRGLKNTAENAPSNLSFTVKSAEEALEAATDHARIEIESFIDSRARALGLERLQDLAQIDTDEKPALTFR